MANAPIPNLDKCLIGPTPYEERDPWAKAGILSDVLEGEMGLKVHRAATASRCRSGAGCRCWRKPCERAGRIRG